jgi:hypothetical protein
VVLWRMQLDAPRVCERVISQPFLELVISADAEAMIAHWVWEVMIPQYAS